METFDFMNLSNIPFSNISTDCRKKLMLRDLQRVYYYMITFPWFIVTFQHDVPPGKHALITVRQPRGDLLWIQTVLDNKKKNDKDKSLPEIITWDDCDIVQVSSIKSLKIMVKVQLCGVELKQILVTLL